MSKSMRSPAPSMKLARHLPRRCATAPTNTACRFGCTSAKVTPCTFKRCARPSSWLFAAPYPWSLRGSSARMQGAASQGDVCQCFYKDNARHRPLAAGRIARSTARVRSACSTPSSPATSSRKSSGELGQFLRPGEASASFSSSGGGSAVRSWWRKSCRLHQPVPVGWINSAPCPCSCTSMARARVCNGKAALRLHTVAAEVPDQAPAPLPEAPGPPVAAFQRGGQSDAPGICATWVFLTQAVRVVLASSGALLKSIPVSARAPIRSSQRDFVAVSIMYPTSLLTSFNGATAVKRRQ